MQEPASSILRVSDVRAAAPRAEPPRIPDHELVRQIGAGSYGEVWLARSVTGAYRAVKIVHRQTFDHDRPFEREFAGIQKFEPISRTHESQVDILHVGRAEGCFYYVMELADDVESGPEIHPDRYTPKTLRSEFNRRAALPVEECIEIALSLATALEHLHKHGLVHRDIKPSNIIFVNGVPKLADIGLVAAADATRSFVGTEGFFPPEGPGTPQADIYSLGKVLYEICTGLDRQDFPDLPTRIVAMPERESLLEVNAIIAKACRAEPHQRYQSAREMHAELVLLQTGKSVRRLRGLERRLRRITRIGIAAAVVGGILAVAFAFQRRQTGLAQEFAETNRKLAEESRRHAAESARHVLRIQGANGTRLMEQGDSIGAALWFAENLKLAKGDPAQERLNRLRLEWVLREYPRIEQIFAHKEGVNTASFSPDGTRVVTASKDDTARVWDARTGEAITPPLPHEDDVWRASFSPDGRFVISSGRDKTARVWDAASGKSIHVLKHADGVTAASFNPGGDRILTASWDGTAQIWNAATGERATPPLKQTRAITSAAWTPDEQRVVTGSEDGGANVWSSAAGEVIHELSHGYRVDSLDISADGKLLLTATGDTGSGRRSQAWVWNLETGKPLVETKRLQGRLRYARFTPDQRRIIVGSDPLGVLRAENGALLFPPVPHGEIHFLAISPDGTRAASATGLNGAARVWDVQTGKELFTPLKHAHAVYHVEFSSDGQRLLTSSDDGMARLWNLVTGSARAATLRHDKDVWLASFSADGSRIATAGLDAKARVWDVATGQLAFPPIENPHPIEQAVFSADGRRLLTAPRNTGRPSKDARPWTTLSVWDPISGQRIGPVISHPPNVLAAAISPDGRYVASGVETGPIQVWEVESGKPMGAPLDQQGRVRILDFSPDGKQLIAVPDSDTVTVWDWRNGGHAFPPLKHSAQIRHAAYSPDGKRIATTGYVGGGRMWDAATGAPLTEPFAHRGLIHFAAWSPDSRWIATCGISPRVRVWDAATAHLALPPLEHGGETSHAAFDPSGTMLLTAAHDKTARLWDLTTGEQIIPPLPHGSVVVQGNFNPQGTAFVTTCLDSHARLWKLPQSELASEDLIRAAQLISGQHISPSGVLTPESPNNLLAHLRTLRERYPRHFDTSLEQVLAWHEGEAHNAEDNRQFDAAAWRLTQLLASRPGDVQLLWRRANAHAEAARWAEAQADFAEFMAGKEARPETAEQQLMLVAWKAGDKAKCREVCEQLIKRARASGDHETKARAGGYATHFPGLFEDLSSAHELLQQALQEKPTDSWRRYRWAHLLLRLGRLDEATEELRQLRANSLSVRNSPSVLFLQAILAQQRGDAVSARRFLSLGTKRLTEAAEDRARPWPALLDWQILREEAEAVIAATKQ